jgi:hypothetical protein
MITKDTNRQAPTVAIVEFGFADLATGVGQVAIDLPSGAIVIGGEIIIDEVYNSSVSDTLEVGDSEAATRYKGSVDGQALGRTALVPTGKEVKSATGSVMLEWTGSGDAPTTGAGRLIVEYILSGRGDFVQR